MYLVFYLNTSFWVFDPTLDASQQSYDVRRSARTADVSQMQQRTVFRTVACDLQLISNIISNTKIHENLISYF